MAQIVQYFEFNNVKSKDFDCIADGKKVFNAPARVYEMVDIPGRNGAYALDMGRYENIEVEYECGNTEASYADFIDKIDAFRNALCSVIGYHRLEDTFHPDEYRMAILKSFEVSPIEFAPASRFNVVFDCKPQRWLKSGETAVSVESGDVLTNPTAFASSPLIMVDGYGEMTVNGYDISIDGSELIGRVDLGGRSGEVARIDLSNTPLNAGDTITITGLSSRVDYLLEYGTGVRIASVTISEPSDQTQNDFPGATYTEYHSTSVGYFTFNFSDALTFQKGTAKTYTVLPIVTFTLTNSTSFNPTYRIQLKYDGANTITFSTILIAAVLTITDRSSTIGSAVAVSTKSILGAPIYIDCDLGSCYKIENDTYVNLNSYIELGSELPVLSSGDNEITYDSTYTSVEIIPRWWQL